MFSGEEIDITHAIQTENNELALFLTKFRAVQQAENPGIDKSDLQENCCVNTVQNKQAGIWQDVILEWRPEIHTDDITIRTSYRDKSITIISSVQNQSGQDFTGRLEFSVEGGVSIPPQTLTVSANESAVVNITIPWDNFIPWTPGNPHLYNLDTKLYNDDTCIDAVRERFGFREVWIQYHRFMLNENPVHWFGEAGHNRQYQWLRPEYVRQWFQRLKDLNMNYVRMHSFIPPEYYLDIADEMGIMVCQESALFESGELDCESDHFWQENSLRIKRMVRRDKNHPSLVLWSVGNKTCQTMKISPNTKQQLSELKKLFVHLDPTRTTYHKGDNSLWDEAEQAVITQDQGTINHGWGWWDHRKPLLAGELNHCQCYNPFTAMTWGNDDVLADYAEFSKSMARKTGRIAELGRASGVSCLLMENTSGFDKMLPAGASSLELNESKMYPPDTSIDILKHTFRPFAIVHLEDRTQGFNNQRIPHSIFLINDLSYPVEGYLSVRIQQERKATWEKNVKVEIPAGRTKRVDVTVRLDKMLDTGEAQIVSLFLGEDSQGLNIRDEVVRDIWVDDISMLKQSLNIPVVAIMGDTALQDWFEGHGIPVRYLEPNDKLNSAETPVLVIAEEYIKPGTDQNNVIEAYVSSGGRVLMLEQLFSIFPGLDIDQKTTEIAWIRDQHHPLMTGLVDDDFRFYADDLYGLPSSNSWVTRRPYAKPRGSHLIRPLIDCGGEDFHDNGLTWSPLLEIQIGEGSLIACQLRITDRYKYLPSVDHLLRNILIYLFGFIPLGNIPVIADKEQAGMLQQTLPQVNTTNSITEIEELANERRVYFFKGNKVINDTAAELAKKAFNGSTVVVWQLNEDMRNYWQNVIGSSIKIWKPEHTVYHLIRRTDSTLLLGISNEDTCWLTNWTDQHINQNDQIVDNLLDIENGINILTNSGKSGLDILFEKNKSNELTPIEEMNTFLSAKSLRVGGALVEVPIGEGRVIFCQMRWQPDKWQFKRFLGLLLWNLGIQAGTNPLNGELNQLLDGLSQD